MPLVDKAECPKCHRKYGERHIATTKRPTLKTIQKWVFDTAIPKATDGCKVEPDGICPHGHSSWLLVIGVIQCQYNILWNTNPRWYLQ